MIKINLLTRALSLAQIRRGFCAPNPSVGAVIVSNNEIIAEGYHLGPGNLHAEVDALNKLTTIPTGAEMYVTLEPCCHYGRTPPCTDAIIRSGIKKVFYAFKDPNPIVAGKGEEKLHGARIHCEHVPVEEINSFYQSYAHWHKTKLPFVSAKIAMSLDGRIAKENGEPLQLTGSEINRYTHQQRKSHDAILTTAKTILADDPQLNVRMNEVIAKPIYILDRELKLTGKEKIFSTAKSITIFYSAIKAEISTSITQPRIPSSFSLLSETPDYKRQVKYVAISEINHFLNLEEILKHIGQDGIHDLWIEAGGKCFANFLENNLLNRALIYLAPIILKNGVPAFPIKTQKIFNDKNIHCKKFGADILYEIHF